LSILSRVLYISGSCLVLNKLKGEAVEGAKNGIVDLQKELKKADPERIKFIEAVNRIDVPVTGCSLFALSEPALEYLNASFSGKNDQTIEKYYWAITEKPKKHPPGNGELVHWIETKSKGNKSFVYNKETPNCKKAKLKYTIKGEGTNYLFVEIQLISGRHHQIRAQLAAIGLYIKGDLKYGAKRSEKNGGIRLHSRQLVFTDPLSPVKKVNIIADPPEPDNLWNAFLTGFNQ